MSFTRKAINFDLSTNELKKCFNNTAEAYSKIKQFMLDNSFEHRQYSGYVSKEPMEDDDIFLLTLNLTNEFSWLSNCVQKFDVTDIGEQYDLTHLLINKFSQKDREISQLQDKISSQDLNLQSKKRVSKRRII